MKAALAITLLILAALTGFLFRDQFWPIGGAHLARVDADFSAIGAAVKAYKMNSDNYPTQGGAGTRSADKDEFLPKDQ